MSIVGVMMLLIGAAATRQVMAPDPSVVDAAAGSGIGAELAFVLPMGVGALVLAAWAGVFRRDSIGGPPRMEPGEPLGGLAVATLMAFVVWVTVPSWYLGRTQTQTQTQTATTTTSAPATTATAPATTTAPTTKHVGGPGREITPGLLRASVAASGVALAVMLVMNAAMRRGTLKLLGLHYSQFPRGIVVGLLGAVILLGLVLLVSTLTELLWEGIHYEHPREHELLRVLDEHRGDRSVSLLVLLSAWVLAPLFEEVFFRGHVQTLVGYGLAMVVARGKLTAEAVSPLEAPVANPGVGARWMGVVVASLLFAAMHAPWTMPPIFVLSLCVGYAYERTGNLWVPIVMHAAFNVTSTLIFLRFGGG